MSIECFPMFAFGFLVGWWMCVATWPRFTRRKPRHDRSGPQLNEGRTIRGNGNGGPTTSKPQFLPGRVLGPGGETIGYRPIGYGPGANPPPRNP